MSSPKGRRLVCCFDGTGNEFGDINSNVVEFFGALTKNKPDEQLVYYQAGIGTYTSPLIATPILAKLASVADEAVAWYLNEHVKEGYVFLMQNYRPGDKICLFGFSRGAYTVRALAGMLHKVGLLPPHNDQQVHFAFKLFQRTDKIGWAQSEKFKKIFTAHDVQIDFVGVWDTVCSVGLIPRQLPFTSSNYAVKVFRQALSIDERRAKFLPNTWNTPSAREAALGFQPQPQQRGDVSKDEWEYEPPEEDVTDVYEVWFSGCHADVGGGSTPERIRLAGISLAWMIKQCHVTNSGILFDGYSLKDIGIDPDTFVLLPVVVPPPITTSSLFPHHGGNYALAEIFDQLVAAPFWWALEVIPLLHSYYHRGQQRRYISRNFGRGRYILPATGKKIHLHKSIRQRMDAGVLKYLPKIQNFSEIESICEWVD